MSRKRLTKPVWPLLSCAFTAWVALGAAAVAQIPFADSGVSASATPVSFLAASQAAVSVTNQMFSLSQAHLTGATTAGHIGSFARHFTVLDRPHHEPVFETLAPGGSIQSLRHRWQLRRRDFESLNPGVDLDSVRAGTELMVWSYDPDNPARSRLRPNRGRLLNGELMPEGDGWVIRRERLAFGATQTLDGLIHALRVTVAAHPKGQDMLIADISRQEGGRFHPHRSHQSGRDVDATYFRETTEEPTFSRTRSHELDLARNWTFLRTLLTQHDITYIFMARRLQERLMAYAESIGEHPAFLDGVFQFGPRHHRNSRAVIRYSPGHDDHMHIRFECTEDDVRCREAR
jgi:hypothetical protein